MVAMADFTSAWTSNVEVESVTAPSANTVRTTSTSEGAMRATRRA